MDLELVGGDYFGLVEDRLGRKFVDLVVSRRAAWNEQRLRFVRETLTTSSDPESSDRTILASYEAATSAGAELDSVSLTISPLPSNRHDWIGHRRHELSIKLNYHLWNLITSDVGLTESALTRFATDNHVVVTFKRSTDDSEANI
jgi:hypothetical protein